MSARIGQTARTVAAIIAMAMLLSCQTTDSSTKQNLGTLIGAGLGAFLGNQVGSGVGKWLATAGGAVIGGLIGREVAKQLTEDDKQAVTSASQQSLASGESVAWSNPESGASGKVDVGPVTYRPGTYTVDSDSEVEIVSDLKGDGADYRVAANANVRAGPSVDKRILTSMEEGSTVTAVARTTPYAGYRWYLVAFRGRTVGYVREDLLRPVSFDVAGASGGRHDDRGGVGAGWIIPGDAAAEEKPGMAAGPGRWVVPGSESATSVAAPAEGKSLTVESPCRLVKSRIRLKEGAEDIREEMFCRSPSGRWEPVPQVASS